jgi:hypothetical protein
VKITWDQPHDMVRKEYVVWIFDVDENVDENESSDIILNEPNEDEVKHDPIEFPNDDGWKHE